MNSVNAVWFLLISSYPTNRQKSKEVMTYALGQRWVSQTEPKLGLGLITEFANRRLTLSFPAAGETRTYATDQAPISRIIYKPGDLISNHEEHKFVVLDTREHNALIEYRVHAQQHPEQVTVLKEVELNCFIQFTSPLQRLMSGHFDRNRAFRLRYETLQHKHRLQQSEIHGLLGARTSLLPHQVYIAAEVASRYAPRVLLADEVGLGKTIEAGMILHAQLHNGLAQRALIVVPDTLVHQWLIEMLRRFNLRFSIFDRERFDSLLDEGIENPFETEQLIICDQNFLLRETVQHQALSAHWDLLIVDEAHHLHWSETDSSEAYRCIEALAKHSRGVLLLTATPEQAGIESHFARLRLLDPDRFHSLPVFIEQEKNYQEITAMVGQLQILDDAANIPAAIAEKLGETSDITPQQAIQRLLDQHGTGRILFRNTRQAVKGFPERILHPYPLTEDPNLSDSQQAEAQIKNHPGVTWLSEFLRNSKNEKSLVICHSAELALTLEAWLRLRQGIRSACFHEGLNIIERDRAAAYFADKDEGAQVLICSEIGSEGRNFQFARHLILFDLPDNPDLLEQRIGRLDRIGQRHDVQIHVPYLLGSRQEGLFHWYHLALDAFTHSCAAGYAIYEQHQAELEQYLRDKDFQSVESQAFIRQVRSKRDEAMSALQAGRDPLLELNSCRPDIANVLIDQIETEENSQLLAAFMERQFNLYGVEQEYQSDHTVIIRPGEHMLEQHFPGLQEEGNTLTFHRLKALHREDVEFITWEHPMVTELIEQTTSGELGNAAVAKISVKGVEPGTLFLEAVFALNSMAPKALQLDRFLPISPQRVLVNISGRDLSTVLPHEQLNGLCSGLKRNMAQAVLKEIRDDISTMLNHAQALAEKAVPELISGALRKLEEQLGHEIQRMLSLQNKNPLIRDEEIAYLQNRLKEGQDYIQKTGLEVQSLRVIINT
jgi:ATP-dependent helicase HepA